MESRIFTHGKNARFFFLFFPYKPDGVQILMFKKCSLTISTTLYLVMRFFDLSQFIFWDFCDHYNDLYIKFQSKTKSTIRPCLVNILHESVNASDKTEHILFVMRNREQLSTSSCKHWLVYIIRIMMHCVGTSTVHSIRIYINELENIFSYYQNKHFLVEFVSIFFFCELPVDAIERNAINKL